MRVACCGLRVEGLSADFIFGLSIDLTKTPPKNLLAEEGESGVYA